MNAELKLDTGTLYSFLLVLARVSGAFIFVPLPGIQTGTELPRVMLALSMTLILFPSWPAVDADGITMMTLIGWLLAEAGMGIAAGLVVAFLSEAFQMGAQIINLQAGYS